MLLRQHESVWSLSLSQKRRQSTAQRGEAMRCDASGSKRGWQSARTPRLTPRAYVLSQACSLCSAALRPLRCCICADCRCSSRPDLPCSPKHLHLHRRLVRLRPMRLSSHSPGQRRSCCSLRSCCFRGSRGREKQQTGMEQKVRRVLHAMRSSVHTRALVSVETRVDSCATHRLRTSSAPSTPCIWHARALSATTTASARRPVCSASSAIRHLPPCWLMMRKLCTVARCPRMQSHTRWRRKEMGAAERFDRGRCC
jgi:hypothetical protein